MAATKLTERLHLAMNPKTRKLLDDLQDRTGTQTMSETIRRALALLDIVSAEEEKGGELYVQRPDGKHIQIRVL